MSNKELVLDVSWGSIFKVAAIAVIIFLLFSIRDILIWFVFGVVLSILFNPLINFLNRARLPRVAATVLVYFVFFGLLGFLVYAMSPFFINELKTISEFFPQYIQALAPPLRILGIEVVTDFQGLANALQVDIEKVASGVVSGVVVIFGGLVTSFFVLTIAVFLSLEEHSIERFFAFFLPKKYEATAMALWRRAQKQVLAWFIVRLLGSIFVGVASYVALVAFNVRYPLSLSLMSGLLNFVPVVGPLIAGFLITVMVALDSTARALFVLLTYILIQQLENNLLTPLLSKRFAGVHPILVLLSLAIGGRLWGLLGAILAVPFAGICFEFLHDFLQRKKQEEGSS